MELIKNKIEKQYNEEQMTQKELAKFHNVSLSTMIRFFKKHAIKSRGTGRIKGKIVENKIQVDTDKKTLEKQHHDQLMTYKDLSEFYDVGIAVIFRLFKEFNIQSRKAGKIKGTSLSQESKDKISKALKGKTKSKEHCKKLSEAMSGENHPNWGKKCKSHGKRHWFKCPNGETVSMRSTWEIAYAKYLNDQNIKWEYEPKTFLLEGGDAYTPDFYLTETDTYVEVKGWLREKHKRKIEGFKSKYPKEKWILANKEYLIKLGIDLKKIWITSKPKFDCIQCNEKFHRKYPDQRLCSVDCRNKFISGGGKLQKKNKPKRKYNGNQSGENNSSSKLTLEDIDEIKNMKKEGIPVIKIAEMKKTSSSNIYNICRGVSWSKK